MKKSKVKWVNDCVKREEIFSYCKQNLREKNICTNLGELINLYFNIT